MVSFVSRAAVATCALVVTACSIPVDGLGADGGGSTTGPGMTGSTHAQDASEPDADLDASQSSPDTGNGMPTDPDAADMPPPEDSGRPDGPSTTRPPFDASACDNAMGTCVVVPSGWSLVAFSTTRRAPCPPGFAMAPAADLVEGPDATAGCGCGACRVTREPSCSVGEVMGWYDTKRTAAAGTCSSPDMMPVLSNSPAGACLTDIYAGAYGTFDVEYDGPSTASGGACSSPGVTDTTAVTYAADERVCTADGPPMAGCTGDVCRPMVPAGYSACIAIAGDQPCPQGPLGVQHLVGTGATFQCSACGCTTSGTCGGDATITLFTDTSCTKGANTMPADTCTSISGDPTYQAYQYDGGAPDQVSCQVGAVGSPQGLALMNEQTICCVQ